ncbi:Uncharacterised protein [Vibrio cholerae]|uniref:Uncharacterized protein n=1 Tax=Vibrio cholerae TaxID=666 RepID=A0A655TBW1_VIBCL|nr:Uncharacterised protein [Vibrio cholerae]CSB41050.1 Uncharacterised protein [Vibrio cholerae]CSB80591.1 Uncharacterised protein [Vibrio cholerae]CSB99056.1 Uncharacterised protein [Vibrio cholerae]CSC19607.1 Uncharacterised protein [Vibrio cholerae]
MQYDGQSDQGNKGIHPNPERMSPSSRKAVLTSPCQTVFSHHCQTRSRRHRP